MAIEITPKKKKRIKWINYALYFSVGILIIALAGYSFLYYSLHNSQKKLSDLESTIENKETTEMKLLEKKIGKYEKKIGYFSELINNHLYPSALFELLEDSVHEEVTFSKLKFNAEHQKATLEGSTESFKTLGEQVLVLELESKVKDLELKKLSIGEGGNIEFEIILSLSQKVIH